MQPFICPPSAYSLRCSQRTGDIGKSLTLRRVAFSLFAVLLGFVKWHQKLILSRFEQYSLRIISYNLPFSEMLLILFYILGAFGLPFEPPEENFHEIVAFSSQPFAFRSQHAVLYLGHLELEFAIGCIFL